MRAQLTGLENVLAEFKSQLADTISESAGSESMNVGEDPKNNIILAESRDLLAVGIPPALPPILLFSSISFVLSIVICWTISCDFSFLPVPRSLCSPSRPPDLLTDSSFVEQACTEELSRTAAKLIENQECFKTMLEEHEPEVRSMVEATTAKAI